LKESNAAFYFDAALDFSFGLPKKQNVLCVVKEKMQIFSGFVKTLSYCL